MLETNKIYNIDNLKLLEQIPNNYIDLIYCDILYNTGRKFKDYNDNLGIPQEAIEWYRPRIQEMYRILKFIGSLYIQCDWRLVHYLKVEIDKIFGINNFKSHIIWKKGNMKGARNKSKKFNSITDDILFYTKTNNYTYNQQFKPIDLNSKNNKYKYKDENGRIYSRDCPLGDYSDVKIKEFEEQGRIYVTKNGKKQLIRYLDEVDGVAISNLWDDIKEINQVGNERLGYDTQKPKALLERIIKASSNEGDIVADFFCGSGTTLVVAKELGRQYVGCDTSSRAVEITNKRLNKVQPIL